MVAAQAGNRGIVVRWCGTVWHANQRDKARSYKARLFCHAASLQEPAAATAVTGLPARHHVQATASRRHAQQLRHTQALPSLARHGWLSYQPAPACSPARLQRQTKSAER